jgi:hypothetical protein
MFCSPKATWKKPDLSVSSENTSQKILIRNYKISEIVNDSESDGGNFNKLSDNRCKVGPVAVAAQSKA